MAMTIEQLKKKHPLHLKYGSLWTLYGACYDGIRAMIDAGVIEQQERESLKNWTARKKEACSFGYSKTIVDIYHNYLNSKPDKNDYGKMGKDELFKMFLKDCNLEGKEWPVFRKNCQRNASIYGVVGLLVDMGNGKAENRSQLIEGKFYPYVAMYAPANILDWKYERDEKTGRPRLVELKLLDEDNIYVIWTPEKWIKYQIVTNGSGSPGEEVKEVGTGNNTLGEIPFVWMINIGDREVKNIGVSDLALIAFIESSIVRDISHANEVIKWAAFPMLMKPEREVNAETGENEKEDTVGVTGVLPFNPELPNGKPEWLVPAVGEAMTAVVSWIGVKIKEIFRNASVGDIPSVEGSQEAKSGEALKREFQMLNALLNNKAKNEVTAELQVLRLWCKWIGEEKAFEEMNIARPDDYSIADLQADLANVMTAKTVLPLKEFLVPLFKRMVRVVLPGLAKDEQEKLDKAIEAYDFSAVSFLPGNLDDTQDEKGNREAA